MPSAQFTRSVGFLHRFCPRRGSASHQSVIAAITAMMNHSAVMRQIGV
jgi:hypothetical protein